jgi:hypothetical protein
MSRNTETQCSVDDFWSSRELLKHIKLVASKTRKSAYAILGWLMVEMLTRIRFETHYVSDVGRASLNMLFLMSAPTGGGKSAARKVAKDNFEFEDVGWSSPEPMQAGSGEAIADAFYIQVEVAVSETKTKWEVDWVNPNHCRVFFNDEISYHKGKSNQNSSTLEATYLSMYSGDLLGRSLAGGRGKEVPAGKYRAIAVFNAQPENDPFRTDAAKASGMPSRLLNLRAINPNARKDFADTAGVELPERPFKIPRFGNRGDSMPPQFRALSEMDAAHAEEDFLASEGKREHGRSHTLLTRAKVSCVLAALDGRDYLTTEDWWLSGHLIEHSNEVDAEIQSVISKALRAEAGKSGAILGYKLGAAEASKDKYALKRVKENVKRWSSATGYDLTLPTTNPSNLKAIGALSQKIAPRDRKPYLEVALQELHSELNGLDEVATDGE